MKKIKEILFIVIGLTSILYSCNKSGGEEYIGNWVAKQDAGDTTITSLIIKPEKEEYYVTKITKFIGKKDNAKEESNVIATVYKDGSLFIAGGGFMKETEYITYKKEGDYLVMGLKKFYKKE